MERIRYVFRNYLIPKFIGFIPCETYLNETEQHFPQNHINTITNKFSNNGYLLFLNNNGYDYPIEFIDINGFLLLVINSKKQRTVQLTVNTFTHSRVWINEEFQGVLWNTIICELDKGDNYIIIEKNSPCKFFVRFSLYSKENEDDYVGLNNKYLLNTNDLSYVMTSMYDTFYYYDNELDYKFVVKKKYTGEDFNFRIIPNSCLIDTEQTIKGKIFDYNSNKKTIYKNFRFNELHTITAKELDYNNDNLYNHLIFEYTYKNDQGSFVTARYHIFNTGFEESIEIIKTQISNAVSYNFSNSFDKYYLERCSRKIDNESYFFFESINKKLDKLYSGCHIKEQYYDRGLHTIYYNSNIDDSEREINLFLSCDNHSQEKLPLVLFYLIPRYEIRAGYISRFKEKFIAADITDIGMTFASYCGEASTLEIIEQIKRIYNVDDSRIYLAGSSAGGASVITLSQMYPHLFSSIASFSGFLNKKFIRNMYNKIVFNVSSKCDYGYENNYLKCKREFEKYTNFYGVVAEAWPHGDLYRLIYKEKILNKIFEGKNERYPNDIFFITQHNYHNKAYWITLHSIVTGKNEMQVEAHIINNNICINLKNSEGITIEIPNQINRSKFNIIINDSVLKFENYNLNCVHIKRNKQKGFYIVHNHNFNTNIQKGLGILYAYVRPLRIICGDNNDKSLFNISERLSKVHTNSYSSDIKIQYPIYNIDNLKSDIEHCNLIVVDNNYNNEILNRIRGSCAIKTDSNGFYYNGTKHIGDYNILQITENIFSNDKSLKIIYFNTNNVDEATQNLFLRKLILPSYQSGYHPFLNNDALIQYNKKFYRVFEFTEYNNIESVK